MSEPYVIKMPQLSDTMTEGVVVSWEKNIGDEVKRGDIVATVETDKAVMDVEVFRDGFLADRLGGCGNPSDRLPGGCQGRRQRQPVRAGGCACSGRGNENRDSTLTNRDSTRNNRSRCPKRAGHCSDSTTSGCQGIATGA
jgi:hypothetical protein